MAAQIQLKPATLEMLLNKDVWRERIDAVIASLHRANYCLHQGGLFYRGKAPCCCGAILQADRRNSQRTARDILQSGMWRWRQTINIALNSYGIKHELERWRRHWAPNTGAYVSNEECILAVLGLGVKMSTRDKYPSVALGSVLRKRKLNRVVIDSEVYVNFPLRTLGAFLPNLQDFLHAWFLVKCLFERHSVPALCRTLILQQIRLGITADMFLN